MFGTSLRAMTSSTFTVRKSMLNLVRPDAFGTVECNWLPQKIMTPPTSGTTRT
jgi:hypothetical protein